jgi:uncharacterized membrane protein (UPF0136 family)
MFAPSSSNIRRWATIGLLFAALQSCMMIIQFVKGGRSPGIAVCMAVSLIYLAAYLIYVMRLRRRQPSPESRWFLISHLLVSTWYFWSALMVFLCHAAGFQIFQLLFDNDTSNDLQPAPRRIVTCLFAFALISLAVDLYTTRFHGVRVRALAAGNPSLGGKSDRPRFAAAAATTCDAVFALLTGLSYGQQHDWGTIVLLIVCLLSFLLECRYAMTAWRAPRVDAEWHLHSQFLALQHALVTSTVFLVNFMLLVLWSIGLSVPAIVQNDSTGQGLQIIVSILAYVGIVICTAVLVGQHTALEAPAHAQAVVGAVAVPVGPGGYHYDALAAAAVPVPPELAHGGGGHAAFAVPLPLAGEDSSRGIL